MQEISFILGQKGMALYEGCYLILALFMFLRLHLPSFCKLVQLTCFPNLAFVEMKKSVIVFIYLFFSENLYGTFFFLFYLFSLFRTGDKKDNTEHVSVFQ